MWLTRSSGKNLWRLLSFKWFSLYVEVSKNCKLIKIQLSYLFACVNSTKIAEVESCLQCASHVRNSDLCKGSGKRKSFVLASQRDRHYVCTLHLVSKLCLQYQRRGNKVWGLALLERTVDFMLYSTLQFSLSAATQLVKKFHTFT